MSTLARWVGIDEAGYGDLVRQAKEFLGGKSSAVQREIEVQMAAAADCVVIATDHSNFDYSKVLDNARLIVDTRNALKAYQSPKIVRL